MATPEPSTNLPATFMSSGKKGRKSRYHEDVHGTRNPDEHIEGIAEDCESSDPEAPPTAFNTNNNKKKQKKNKKTPTSNNAMDSTAVALINETATEREVEPTVNFADFLHDLSGYAQPGADAYAYASSEVDQLYHEALQEHAMDPAPATESIEQGDAFQDSTNAERTEYRAPAAVMGFHVEHETPEPYVSSSSTTNGHVVESETPPTAPPKGDWKRLPIKATSMFKKVDLLDKDRGGSGDDEASADEKTVVKTIKTRKRGRPSKIDKLAERNAKRAKTEAGKGTLEEAASRRSLRSRSVKDEPAPTPARPRGRPSKASARPQAEVNAVEAPIKRHALRSRASEDEPSSTPARPRARAEKAVKFTDFSEQPASTPAQARGRPTKNEDSARPLSPMRAAKKAAKNAPAAGKGGPVTRTRSQELKALIGKSSLRSAAKQESLKNLKNGRDAWKKEKKSNKAKVAKIKQSKIASGTTENSNSKYAVKIGTGVGKRRKRRGVSWTTKKSKKGKAAQNTVVDNVQVIIDNVFDKSKFIVCEDV